MNVINDSDKIAILNLVEECLRVAHASVQYVKNHVQISGRDWMPPGALLSVFDMSDADFTDLLREIGFTIKLIDGVNFVSY